MIAVIHTTQLSSCEIKASRGRNSGMNGIQTQDLCDTSAVLFQLSYQAWSHCEFVIYAWKEKNANEYMNDHIFKQQRKMRKI